MHVAWFSLIAIICLIGWFSRVPRLKTNWPPSDAETAQLPSDQDVRWPYGWHHANSGRQALMWTCLAQIQTWTLLTFLALITFFPQKDKTERAKIFLFSIQISWEQHKRRRGGREDPSSRSSVISHEGCYCDTPSQIFPVVQNNQNYESRRANIECFQSAVCTFRDSRQ